MSVNATQHASMMNQSIPLYQGLSRSTSSSRISANDEPINSTTPRINEIPQGEWRLSKGYIGGGKWRLRFVGFTSRLN